MKLLDRLIYWIADRPKLSFAWNLIFLGWDLSWAIYEALNERWGWLAFFAASALLMAWFARQSWQHMHFDPQAEAEAMVERWRADAWMN